MNIIIGTAAAALLWAAAPAMAEPACPPGGQDTQRSKAFEAYSITEVRAHRVPASNYVQGEKTKLYFQGTSRMPGATGEAKIRGEEGYTQVDADFDHLEPACSFGPDYLTYVLWAVTPEGRASNLGELILNGKRENKAKLDVTTEFQAFGLMVTAEPHFAVSRPSNIIVLQNIARPEPVAANVCADPCVQGGTVTRSMPGTVMTDRTRSSDFHVRDSEKPGVVEAGENIGEKTGEVIGEGVHGVKRGIDAIPGVGIDSSSRSEADAITKTGREVGEKTGQVIDETGNVIKKGLDAIPGVGIDSSTDSAQFNNGFARPSVVQARNAVRLATDAGANQYAPEILNRANGLLSKAEMEDHNGMWARSDAFAREAAQTAEDARLISERGAMLAALERRDTEFRARIDTDESRLKADEDVFARDKAMLEESERELLKAEDEKAALRAKLQQQLNMIMVTRDTVRGLIVDMKDVTFPVGQHQLDAHDREKLAKVAGILLSYPGLTLEVDGYTDNTGTSEFNQRLSERRANAVRDYLVSAGIPESRITAKGFGENNPTSTNDTAEGRQQNRRVELVVAGDVIGVSEDEIGN